MATKTKEVKDRRTKQTDQAELEPKQGGGNGGNGKHHAAKRVWSHETKKRCPRCGAMMRANGTTAGGARKRWICTAPVCRRTDETVGRPV